MCLFKLVKVTDSNKNYTMFLCNVMYVMLTVTYAELLGLYYKTCTDTVVKLVCLFKLVKFTDSNKNYTMFLCNVMYVMLTVTYAYCHI